MNQYSKVRKTENSFEVVSYIFIVINTNIIEPIEKSN